MKNATFLFLIFFISAGNIHSEIDGKSAEYIENCDALEYARQYGQMEIYDYIKERLHKD